MSNTTLYKDLSQIEDERSEHEKLVAEFLENGGEIEFCDPGARTEQDDIAYTHGWGRKKKKATPAKKG